MIAATTNALLVEFGAIVGLSLLIVVVWLYFWPGNGVNR